MILTETYADKITALLPTPATRVQFLAGLTTAIQKNPSLLDCSDASLLSAAMMCASYGMVPNTPLGEAWIIPYSNHGHLEASFQMGYQGTLKLIYETPYVAKVDARVVREGDEFKYKYGTDEYLEHTPVGGSTDGEGKKRAVTHVYGMVYLKSGAVKFEVLDVPQVEERRKRSKTPNRGPWVTDWEKMAMRTALLEVVKYIPKSNRLARIEADEVTQDITDAEYTVEDTNADAE